MQLLKCSSGSVGRRKESPQLKLCMCECVTSTWPTAVVFTHPRWKTKLILEGAVLGLFSWIDESFLWFSSDESFKNDFRLKTENRL